MQYKTEDFFDLIFLIFKATIEFFLAVAYLVVLPEICSIILQSFE